VKLVTGWKLELVGMFGIAVVEQIEIDSVIVVMPVLEPVAVVLI